MSHVKFAFEGGWPSGSHRSTSSAASTGSEVEGRQYGLAGVKRIVGFAENGPEGCDRVNDRDHHGGVGGALEERASRQSSLGKQLLLYSFEQEQKPKLPTINTKGGLRLRERRNASSIRSSSSSNHNHNHNHAHGPGQPPPLPTAVPHRGSGAVDIPERMVKAYTAPEQMPELSPSLQRLLTTNTEIMPLRRHTEIERKNSHPSFVQPQPSETPLNLDVTTPHARSTSSTVNTTNEENVSGQVAALRMALFKEQEEVLKLRRELAQLKTELLMARSSSDRLHAMAPVTPDALGHSNEMQNENGGAGRSNGWTSPFDGFPCFA